MFTKIAVLGSALAAGYGLMTTAASADTDIPGKVIVARATGDATVLYDATPEVAAIVKGNVPDAAANDRLERDALRVLAKEAPVLVNATTITVRVTYARTGEVSPMYGTPTFMGIERYANLTMSAANAKADKGRWKETATGTGTVPSSVGFTIVGKLPPRS